MDYTKLLEKIKDSFIRQEEYFFDKHVPEFNKDDKFFADYFNQIAVEPLGDKPPRFYHTFSPFDVVSNKAPHYAVVFEAGKKILDIEFDKYVSMRTAVMSVLVLKSIGTKSLKDKKVLIFGSGKIATESVKILNSVLGLSKVNIISRSGDLSKIKSVTSDLNILIEVGDISKIEQFDVIIAHTQTAKPLLTTEDLSRLKKGAILASFISSTEHGEFVDEVYDTDKANIITDWPQTLTGAKDLNRAIKSGICNKKEVLQLKEFLLGVKLNKDKQYTVYRSTGTPIQNLAILKALLSEK